MTPVDIVESSTHSPASKAFADRLAKYAYIHKNSGSSGENGPKTTWKRNQDGDGDGEIRRSPRKLPVRRYTDSRDGEDSTSDSGSDGRGPVKAAPSIGRKRKTRASIESASTDISVKEDEGDGSVRGKGKRKVKKVESGKTKGKKPRGYADPEIYAHLEPVGDLLRPGLDIVFCGINPGKRSSTLGHHFSHPSNKFWKAVHQSGLTSRLLSPLEDELLLDEFGYGLTNLVDRPTSEQSELSTMEMRLSVYTLLEKFMAHRPLVVCFVGKKIWDVFQGVVQRTATQSTTAIAGGGAIESHPSAGIKEIKNEIQVDKEIKVEASPQEGEGDILQKVKIELEIETIDQSSPRPDHKPNTIPDPSPKRRRIASVREVPIPFDAKQPRLFRLRHPNSRDDENENEYTYFWVVPNTSGLERTQLPEQVINFTCLRMFVQQLKAITTSPTTGMSGSLPVPLNEAAWKDIDPDGVKRTVEDIRRNVIAGRTCKS